MPIHVIKYGRQFECNFLFLKTVYPNFQTYLNDPSSRYNLDVDFSDDGKHILGARFVIQGSKIYNANMEKQFVEELR